MIREGTDVRWAWGDGFGAGTVVERHESSIKRTLDGTEVTRNGSTEDPALVIEQEDGATVLKLESEVERAEVAS